MGKPVSITEVGRGGDAIGAVRSAARIEPRPSALRPRLRVEGGTWGGGAGRRGAVPGRGLKELGGGELRTSAPIRAGCSESRGSPGLRGAGRALPPEHVGEVRERNGSGSFLV